jgi:hypothetical protein
MTTYSSDKAVPYVYICTHKETNQFYIGYREKNVKLNRPSHLDLPEYKTSSTTVRPDWENYTWTIVAEFFDPKHAYTFEQQLICDNWDNPLLLNGYYRLGKIKQFRVSGPRGKPSPLKGKPNGRKGIPTGPSPLKGKPSPLKGKPTGKPAWNKGKPSPKKGIPTGKPSPLKGKPTGKPAWNKGKPSPLKGKPNGRKGIPTGPQQNPTGPRGPSGPQQNPSNEPKWNKGISTGPRGPYRKQRTVECPHCGLVGRGGGMTRHHFDNCKTILDL